MRGVVARLPRPPPTPPRARFGVGEISPTDLATVESRAQGSYTTVIMSSRVRHKMGRPLSDTLYWPLHYPTDGCRLTLPTPNHAPNAEAARSHAGRRVRRWHISCAMYACVMLSYVHMVHVTHIISELARTEFRTSSQNYYLLSTPPPPMITMARFEILQSILSTSCASNCVAIAPHRSE